MSEATIFPEVVIGPEAILEDHCIVGCPPKFGAADPTRIGREAHLRSHTVIYADVVIGDHFFCGHHVTIREHCRLGHNVSVGTGTVLEHSVTIEDGVRLHSSVYVPEFTVLRAGCWIGPRACFTNAKYPTFPGSKEHLAGVEVGPGAVIGANATILPGVKIGEQAFVGAGAVVTKSIEPGVLVVGNPARVIRRVHQISH